MIASSCQVQWSIGGGLPTDELTVAARACRGCVQRLPMPLPACRHCRTATLRYGETFDTVRWRRAKKKRRQNGRFRVQSAKANDNRRFLPSPPKRGLHVLNRSAPALCKIVCGTSHATNLTSRIDLDWLIETRGRTLTMGPRRGGGPFGNAGAGSRVDEENERRRPFRALE